MPNEIGPGLVAGDDPGRDDDLTVGRDDLYPCAVEGGGALQRHASFWCRGVQDPELEPGILADHRVLRDHCESSAVNSPSDLHLFIDGADRLVVPFVGHEPHAGQGWSGRERPG